MTSMRHGSNAVKNEFLIYNPRSEKMGIKWELALSIGGTYDRV